MQKDKRPIVGILPGLCGQKTDFHMIKAIQAAHANGYLPVIIGYRGAPDIHLSVSLQIITKAESVYRHQRFIVLAAIKISWKLWTTFMTSIVLIQMQRKREIFS